MNRTIRDKYINLFTDYGFKRIFGSEMNKDILIDFLNELLKNEEGKIKSIKYLNSENMGNTEIDRRAVFDIYCENEKGEKFIVELQKAKQDFFKERSVYYSTFPIQRQAEKGIWNFELKSVYTIGILDFIFDEDKKEKDKMVYFVKLSDIETKKVFYDKLTFVYIEIPKFTKKEKELTTHFDKWLFILKNLHRLQKRPAELQEKIFNKLFETAEISKLTRDEYDSYEGSLKYYRDMTNVVDTAKNEGLIEGERLGIEKGRKDKSIEIAEHLLKNNVPADVITNSTGLTIKEIEALRKK